MFKKGDRVRVKRDLTLRFYGKLQPSMAMLTHRGEEFSVKEVGTALIDTPVLILEGMESCVWSFEMLEPIEKVRST